MDSTNLSILIGPRNINVEVSDLAVEVGLCKVSRTSLEANRIHFKDESDLPY